MPAGSTLFYASRYAVGTGWEAPLRDHSHPFPEILLVLRGRMGLVRDGKRLTLQGGESLAYGSGEVHREWVERGPCEFLCLGLGCEPLLSPTQPFRDPGGRLAILAGWIVSDSGLRWPAPDSTQGERALLAAFLAEWQRAIRDGLPGGWDRIRSHMRAHLDQAWSLDALARMAGLSKYHFAHRYRRDLGITPMGDLKRIRLAAAAEWLLTTDQPLKAVAERAGFSDESHFSREFRKAMGVAPGAYRARPR